MLLSRRNWRSVGRSGFVVEDKSGRPVNDSLTAFFDAYVQLVM